MATRLSHKQQILGSNPSLPTGATPSPPTVNQTWRNGYRTWFGSKKLQVRILPSRLFTGAQLSGRAQLL